MSSIEQNESANAILALEDGTFFTGKSFGADGEIDGEVVFNTSMTGYQEILTDPSYRGQIVVMTYPEIGNYGVNEEDIESANPHLAGFVVRENSRIVSNFRADSSLSAYLKSHGIIALEGIDTRQLVRHIRQHGAMKGVLSTIDSDTDNLVLKARQSLGLVGRDLVKEVIPSQPVHWNEKLSDWWRFAETETGLDEPTTRAKVVALDFGMKRNICRHLVDQGFEVIVLPGTASAEEVLSHSPDGLFLSNGPGDPSAVSYAIETIKSLLGKLPIFGICLGHQLLALACGAKTFKLKFGHRGANQPVLDLETGKIEITTQNHGFAVDEECLPADLIITHRHMNDNTIAGLKHRDLPVFCVQYHPEASAGPHDSEYLFDRFFSLIKSNLRQSIH